MNISFRNPFKDVTRDPRAAFKENMLYTPEEVGNLNSKEVMPRVGTKLTNALYNDLFEGDSWSLPSEHGHTHFNYRATFFTGDRDGSLEIADQAKEGVMGTSVFAEREHAHYAVSGGDDKVAFTGNSQRNIAVVEMESGQKSINLDLKGGDDKAVLFLEGTSGTIFVDGGEGDDLLEIHSRDPKQTYTLLRDPEEVPEQSEGLQTVTRSIEKVKTFKGR